jgi:hypothetical protein
VGLSSPRECCRRNLAHVIEVIENFSKYPLQPQGALFSGAEVLFLGRLRTEGLVNVALCASWRQIPSSHFSLPNVGLERFVLVTQLFE